MEKDIPKNAGPNRLRKVVEPMPSFEHDFKEEVCTRCNKTFREAYTSICDADAEQP